MGISISVSEQIDMIRQKCSIIKPIVMTSCITYNHEPYIRDTLEGFIMQQTNFPFVAVIHDDASTDGTKRIIQEYAEKYPEIIFPVYEPENLYSKHNGSFSNTIREIYKAIGAKYIALCEGDDFWIDPLKLQKQVDFLESNNDYGMCYTNFDILYQNSGKLIKNVFKTLPKKFKTIYESPEEFVYLKGYVCPPSWVFRNECLPDNSIQSVDGTFTHFTHFLATTKVKYIDEITTTYRILEESASHSSDVTKIIEREKNILKTQIELIEKYNLDKKLIPICEVRHYSRYLANFIIINDKEEIKRAKLVIKKKSFKIKVLFLIANLRIGRLIRIFRSIKSTLGITN